MERRLLIGRPSKRRRASLLVVIRRPSCRRWLAAQVAGRSAARARQNPATFRADSAPPSLMTLNERKTFKTSPKSSPDWRLSVARMTSGRAHAPSPASGRPFGPARPNPCPRWLGRVAKASKQQVLAAECNNKTTSRKCSACALGKLGSVCAQPNGNSVVVT